MTFLAKIKIIPIIISQLSIILRLRVLKLSDNLLFNPNYRTGARYTRLISN